MPAAAVIPGPIAYFGVVAVKEFVVGTRRAALVQRCTQAGGCFGVPVRCVSYFEKNRVSIAGSRLNTLHRIA